MKLHRLLLIPAISLACATFCFGSGNEIMKITDDEGKEVVSMRPPVGESEDFNLSISGFDIGFSTRDNETRHEINYRKHQRRMSRRASFKNPVALLEFGLNTFTDGDYTLYSPSGDYRMVHNPWKSAHVQWNIIRFKQHFDWRQNFGFGTGIGLAWDRYAFDNRYGPGADCRLTSGKCRDKTAKLNTFSFTMPLLFGANINRMVVGVGVYGTVSLRQKHKNMLSGMVYEMESTRFVSRVNPDAGLMASFGLRGFTFFAKYSFRNFSDSNIFPKTDVLTFGIGLF